jgi:hypothetical protein
MAFSGSSLSLRSLPVNLATLPLLLKRESSSRLSSLITELNAEVARALVKDDSRLELPRLSKLDMPTANALCSGELENLKVPSLVIRDFNVLKRLIDCSLESLEIAISGVEAARLLSTFKGSALTIKSDQLTLEEATIIATYQGTSLGVVVERGVSAETLETLARFESHGKISRRGRRRWSLALSLPSLSVLQAQALKEFKGGTFSLSGPKTISADALRSLALIEVRRLELDLERIPAESTTGLSAVTQRLTLLIKSLDLATAQALALSKSHKLYLPNVTHLGRAEGLALLKSSARLDLSGLKSLDRDVFAHFMLKNILRARHVTGLDHLTTSTSGHVIKIKHDYLRGRRRAGKLTFKDIGSIDPTFAQALAAISITKLTISDCGELSEESARYLSMFKGEELTLSTCKVSPKGKEALHAFKGSIKYY